MLGGKNKHLSLGYTIVEVMIVLAVSGMMFLIAANFINGKQESTAFTQGVNETASRLQGLMEDVSDGHYSDIPLGCSVGANSLSFPPGSQGQGTNQDCTFLGKVIHFSLNGNPSQYEVVSIAAAREANPTPDLTSAIYQPATSLTDQQSVPQSLLVSCVEANTSLTCTPGRASYAIGFVQNQGADSNGIGEASGAQSVGLVYGPSVSAGLSSAAAAAALSSSFSPTALSYAKSADICIRDDLVIGRHKADISIGTAHNNQLGINVTMGATPQCP